MKELTFATTLGGVLCIIGIVGLWFTLGFLPAAAIVVLVIGNNITCS